MCRKTLVISIDALYTSDYGIIKDLPHLGPILKNCARAEDVLCCYPTLTYPCHATIMTGCYPDRHGIVHNELLQFRDGRSDWFWWRRDIRVKTMLDAAREHGLTTASVVWPVMCGPESSDYTIGEVWAPAEYDDPTPWFDRADTGSVRQIFEKNKSLLHWMFTPQMDLFAAACGADIIRQFRPDLMAIHFSSVDHRRHNYGGHHEEVRRALAFVDEQIGVLVDAIAENGDLENTVFAVLGDHGHMPCQTTFRPNRLLLDKGWLKTNGKGVVEDYRMFFHSCGHSAQVYVAPEMDLRAAEAQLRAWAREYPQFILRVLTEEELKRDYHLTGGFRFMIETAEDVGFAADALGPLCEPVINLDYKQSVSTHGHLPERGEKPPFLLAGPGVKKNAVVSGGRLIDEAPTILALYGISMENVDGHVLPMLEGMSDG